MLKARFEVTSGLIQAHVGRHPALSEPRTCAMMISAANMQQTPIEARAPPPTIPPITAGERLLDGRDGVGGGSIGGGGEGGDEGGGEGRGNDGGGKGGGKGGDCGCGGGGEGGDKGGTCGGGGGDDGGGDGGGDGGNGGGNGAGMVS